MKKFSLLSILLTIFCLFLTACSTNQDNNFDNYEPQPCSHQYSQVITAPTCTTDGYTIYSCTKCSNSYTDNIVPATGHSYVERTQNYICSKCDRYEDNGFTFQLITTSMANYNNYYKGIENTYQITSVSSKALENGKLLIPRKHLGYSVSGLYKGSLYNVRSSIKELVFQSNIKYLGSSLFCSDGQYYPTNTTFSLQKITFDNSCSNICISHSAFSFCKNVNSISWIKGCFTTLNHDDTIGNHFLFEDTAYYKNNVSVIDGLYYLNDLLLTSNQSNIGFNVNIREGTTLIANYVFKSNTNITTAYIPNSVKYIGKNAFANCSNLTTINYSGDFSEFKSINIESNAFENVNITKYNYNFN